MPHSGAFTLVCKAPLITCNPHDQMQSMSGISSFSLYSLIIFKTSQFVFGPSMVNWVILSIFQVEGNPFKNSSNITSWNLVHHLLSYPWSYAKLDQIHAFYFTKRKVRLLDHQCKYLLKIHQVSDVSRCNLGIAFVGLGQSTGGGPGSSTVFLIQNTSLF